jgi:hypothetical protein
LEIASFGLPEEVDVALLLNRGFCGQLAVFYHLNRGQTAGIGVPVVLERKLALRGNDLFYEGAATSTRLDFPSGPHFRHRGFGVIQQTDDTKPHVFPIGA